MNIDIKATNTTLTIGIKDFINEKLQTISQFIRPEHKIRVELEVEKKHHSGLIYRGEINIHPNGHYAEARGNDFYEAFDLLIPKIKEQLVKDKDKKVSLRRRRQKI